jgi:hypothetical protein
MGTPTPLEFTKLYKLCGQPKPTPADISAWNNVKGDSTQTAVVKMGLFGYDITCLEHECTEGLTKKNYYCDIIKA